MNVSFSFSGGISHDKDIPVDQQALLASRIANVVKNALDLDGSIGGSGSVTVGGQTATISTAGGERSQR